MGKYQAHVLSEIFDGHAAAVSGDDASAPRVIFTDPQVAAVGLTLRAAMDQGVDARAYDVPSSGTAGGAFYGINTPGTVRIVVDEQRGVIVGATFTGAGVAEWLQAATIAIVSKTPVELLWHAVPAFPTRSEIWLKLLERREADLHGERAATNGPPRGRPPRPRPSQSGTAMHQWRPGADHTPFGPGGIKMFKLSVLRDPAWVAGRLSRTPGRPVSEWLA